jgi:hypothetical protein
MDDCDKAGVVIGIFVLYFGKWVVEGAVCSCYLE